MTFLFTEMTLLTDLMFKVRAPLYNCLTVSQPVNSCGSSSELTQRATQKVDD